MTRHYSRLHVLLHWTFATIIIWATLSGFANALYSLPASVSNAIGFINVSLTALLIPLFALRILCALDRREMDSGHRGLCLLAKTGHLLLYIVTALTLITGVLMMERPVDIFGLVQLPQPLQDPALTRFFNTQHKYACIVMAVLIVGHIGAVIAHHVCGDKILKRMSL
ncbi:cytochrome b/b6 domain-containing protein [Ectopseudomonas mendocina]|uniref:Cytochrome b/b6 domain-containing protein n=1 Tax=Ectopseudomonas mendocina TaxID=300 RepID=A0ABZ2RE83_ECTME